MSLDGEKRIERKREIANCDNESFSCSSTIGVEDLTQLGLCTPDAILPALLPLRKHHYFLAKNKQTPVQTHCLMCNMSIRNSLVRSCPDSDLINRYLLEQTSFEGNLSKDTKVCYSCYKCQLQIKENSTTGSTSTDTDLSELISSLKKIMPGILGRVYSYQRHTAFSTNQFRS